VKITDVETIHINPRLAARNADQKARFSGIDTQTLFKVTADNGITGWGDTRTHVSLSDKA
jgi:L-alanine-DL-glutamate epimerase-like enolase superfamily enzyme